MRRARVGVWESKSERGFGSWFLPTTVRPVCRYSSYKSPKTSKPQYLESCNTAHVVKGILS
jgi:hypothetical protein